MKPQIKKSWRAFLRLTLLQFCAAAAVFIAIIGLRSAGLEKVYDTVLTAFQYNIPARDKDEDIGKIKFVNAEP